MAWSHVIARPSSKAALARGSPSLARAAPRSRSRQASDERGSEEGSAELLPFRVDGSLEAERVFVSSEAGGGQGEAEDLDGLLHHVFACERGFEGAQPVLLGKGVVPPVHGAVGEVVIRRAHVHDVFAVARRGMELQCQRFRALELAGYDEHLANAGERAVDECVVTETARELEVLLEQLECARLLRRAYRAQPSSSRAASNSVSSPTVCQSSIACSSRLSARLRTARVRVDRPEVGQRAGRERSVLHG